MAGNRGKAGILIVENEASAASELAARLQILGYEVRGIVPTIETILDLVEEERPDLVIMNIEPQGEMDAVETAEIVRDRFGAPVVFLTANADSDLLERAGTPFSFGYLTKPLRDRDIRVTVETALYVSKVDEERRIAESALEKSEKEKTLILNSTQEMYRLILEHADIGIGYYSIDGIIRHFNPTAANYMNGKPEDFVGKSIFDQFDKESASVYYNRIRAAAETHEPLTFEDFVPSLPSGENFWFKSTYQRIQDEKGNVKGVMILSHDITDIRTYEENLLTQVQFVDTLIETIPNPVFYKDINGYYIGCNKSFEEFIGLTRDKIIGKTVYDLAPKDIADKYEAMDLELFSNPKKQCYEWKVKVGSGETREVIFEKAPIRDANANVVGLIGIITDITERKNAEKALKDSEFLLNETGRMARIGGWEHDLITGEGKWTKALYDIIEIESGPVPGAEEHLAYYPHEDRSVLEQAYRNAVKHGTPFDLKLKAFTAKGRKIWCRATGEPVYENGECTKMKGTFQEITEQILAEEAVKKSLKEKEVLLQEIHHRVKNNLQVVLSLLKLQSNSLPDEKMQQALDDSYNRIHAIGMVHEMLYRSDNLSEIDFEKYASNLLRVLVGTYLTSKDEVKITIDIDKIKLGIDKANPLGLVMNELITNSLKYAFPGEKIGEIQVNAKYTAGELELVVSDNGIGFPKNYDWENANSLGLRLVESLVRTQLGGTIELAGEKGAAFTIVIPMNE